MMETLTPIEWKVLEVTAAGPENLEQIYEHLHVPLADTADAIQSLVSKGLLESKGGDPPRVSEPDDPSRYWRSRFVPTSHGKEVLVASEGRPPAKRRSLLGIYAGRIPDVPFEVFKENRREMSRKYAEDADDE